MKLGIIIDSSSGISKEESAKLGYGFLPLYLTIDGKEYTDGDTISPNNYYDLATFESDVKTSATPPGIIEDVVKEMSTKFDNTVVLSLASNLSSQNQNIKMLSGNFNNIHVATSSSVGSIIKEQVKDIIEFASNTEDIDLVVQYASKISGSTTGIVVPQDLKWLVKGGRVGPKAAAMANLLKIVPLIKLKDGKLESIGKGRTFEKTVKKAALQVIGTGAQYKYFVYSANSDYSREIVSFIKENGINVIKADFPPVIVNHVGPGSIGIIKYKK